MPCGLTGPVDGTEGRGRQGDEHHRRTVSEVREVGNAGDGETASEEVPDDVEPVRLYEAYLRNFEIESGRGAL
jgi:hypothetical protein